MFEWIRERQARGLGFMNQDLKDIHVDNNYKDMPKGKNFLHRVKIYYVG